jgi:endo-1,4-beta-D-glucanase Y
MKRIAGVILFLFVCTSVYAKAVNLSGTVKDGKGNPVAEAMVSITSDSTLKDTTDAKGEFKLSNVVSGIGNNHAFGIPGRGANAISLKENQLLLSIASPANNGVVAIFSSDGKTSVTIALGKMEPGVRALSLPNLSMGFHLVRFTIDGATSIWKLLKTGNEILVCDNVSQVSSNLRISLIAKAASVDTLIIKKTGYQTIKQALTSLTQSSIAVVTDSATISTNKDNLFASLLGKTDEEVNAKLDKAFQQLFHGTGDQPIYYEGGSGAYIKDVNNNDVRSEGQSYGMMICVQYDKKTEFNKIWSWTKSVMGRGSAGNFGWQASPSGSLTSSGSAPDGEEYIATALIFAGKRWNDANLTSQGRSVCGATKQFFNGNLCQFIAGSGDIDVSYVLPAFYEVWAAVDNGNSGFWKTCASTGRNFFHNACNKQTMLTPKRATTGGSPSTDGYFEADSWRVVANIMADWHFFGVDKWQKDTYAPTYAKFWRPLEAKDNMPDELDLNGNVRVSHQPPAKALVAYNAMLGFALPPEEGKFFVQKLWDLPLPTGQYRYYDGCIYLMALSYVSGKFKLYY